MPVSIGKSSCAVPATSSKTIEARVALLEANDRQIPNECVLTIVTSAVAQGANSADVSTVFAGGNTTTKLIAGQPLRWRDPTTDMVYMSKVSANYVSGGTLDLEAVDEEIPVGAQAVFPVELVLRTDIQTASAINTQEAATLDHKVNDASPGAQTITNNLPGLYTHYCAGQATCQEAVDRPAKKGKEIAIRVLYPNPSADAASLSQAPERRGVFFVTALNEGAPNDQNLTFDVTGRFTEFERVRAAA